MKQMLNASSESPPDIVDWNIVAAFDDSLADATDGFAHIGNPNGMQLDPVTALLRFFENHHVSFSTER